MTTEVFADHILVRYWTVWTFFFFPELKGRSIESMESLFSQSAFTIRKRAYPTEDEKVLSHRAVSGQGLLAGNMIPQNEGGRRISEADTLRTEKQEVKQRV